MFAFTAGVGVELPAPTHPQNCSAGPLSVHCELEALFGSQTDDLIIGFS